MAKPLLPPEGSLNSSLTEKSLKDAVLEITSLTGLPKRQIYQKALALTKKD